MKKSALSSVVAISVGGETVHLETVGTDGRIYGSKPGFLTNTWWHADGRHNLYPSLSLRQSSLEAIKKQLSGGRK
jgi:hypothetical protein